MMYDIQSIEEKKKSERMKFIYNALENGWTVKKSEGTDKTFEFSKNNSEKLKELLFKQNVHVLLNHETKKVTKIVSEPFSKNKQS